MHRIRWQRHLCCCNQTKNKRKIFVYRGSWRAFFFLSWRFVCIKLEYSSQSYFIYLVYLSSFIWISSFREWYSGLKKYTFLYRVFSDKVDKNNCFNLMQQTPGRNKINEAICFFESQMASYDVCSLQTFHKEITYGDRIIRIPVKITGI